MAPGISNTCGVCGRKCLKLADLEALVRRRPSAGGNDDDDGPGLVGRLLSAELCGGCGGKFVN